MVKKIVEEDSAGWMNFRIALFAGIYVVKFLEIIFPFFRRKEEHQSFSEKIKSSIKFAVIITFGFLLWEYVIDLIIFLFSRKVVYLLYPLLISVPIFILAFFASLLATYNFSLEKFK